MRFSKVILIHPKLRYIRGHLTHYNVFPSVSMAYLAANLRKNNIDVIGIDQYGLGTNPYPTLKNEKPSLVGISIESANLFNSIRIAKFAKKIGHKVIAGGPHVSLIKEKILNNKFIDFAIYGDGDQAIVDVFNDNSKEKIPGLIYRDHNKIRINNQQEVNIEHLNFPDYAIFGYKKIRNYPLLTSRGCLYKCSFCTTGETYQTWQQRSAQNIVDELKLAKLKYKIKRFIVLDENFTHNLNNVKLFCKVLIKSNIDLSWHIMEGIRVDKVDLELLNLLKKSGCTKITYAIESVDENVLISTKKGINLNKIKFAIRTTKKAGLKVQGFFIIGLPGSSYKSDLKGFIFAVRNLDTARFWLSTPFYGTMLYSWVKSNGKILREPIGKNLIAYPWQKPFYEFNRYKSQMMFINYFTSNSFFIGKRLLQSFKDRLMMQHEW